MQKIICILFIVVFISGCSVARKSSVVNTEDAVAGTISEKTIVERNLTKGNFYIQKAEIELYSVGETVNLLATLKYQKEGRYLITVRTRSGVEVVRILMANDTLLANDRINKKLYQGSTSYLKSKYGISFSTLPVILGDYIYDNNIGEGIIVCNRGKAEIIKNEGNRRINYIVSCKEKKVAVARFSSETGEGKIEIELADFIRDGNYLYPRSCQIMDTESKSVIKIKIKKIEFDTDNNLKFIPGSNYEKVVLK